MKKRKIFDELLREKDNHKVSIIIGARQVGKTTVLRALHEKLSGLFLDLDVLENFEKVSTFSNLVNTLKLNGYREKQKEFFYLFLDEFQRYEDLSIVMKNVYDNRPNVKIYASGSSSLKIKERVQESLAGRKRIHHLYPVDFEEFLWFKGNKEAIKQFNNINLLEGDNLELGTLRSLLEEYLVYGGYPEVVLSQEDKKAEVLKSIFDLYVKKELVGYLRFGKVLGVKKLVEYLAINNGQKIKYEEAGEKCSLRQYDVKEYLEILKETFLLTEVRPFFTNKNRELVKIPKVYFMDNGVRNFFINNFNKLSIRKDSGFLFEAFVLQELIKSGLDNIKFWQDKQRHEVDFVLDLISRQIPIEVKFKSRLKHEDFNGLDSFLENYDVRELYLINFGVQRNSGKTRIRLPFNLNISRK